VVPRVLCIFYGVYIEKFMFALLLVVEMYIEKFMFALLLVVEMITNN
jgi:hypothetical protein